MVGALALSLALAGGAAWAVPAAPGEVKVKQPDGTEIRLRLKGDERLHWHEDTKGFPVVRSKRTKFWVYARKVRGRLRETALVVGRADPAAAGVAKVTGAEARAMRAAAADSAPAPELFPGPRTGTIRHLVIPTAFSDKAPDYTREQLDDLFNQIPYVYDGAAGSVREYYAEVTQGSLTIQSTVVDWVTLAKGYAYYGTNTPSDDYRVRDMVAEAIAALDARGFDFSTMDGDGDGRVDMLTIVHAGGGEEYGGNDPDYIWSHQWALTSAVTYDGVSLRYYVTVPSRRGWDSLLYTQGITRIGVCCHELGHFMGLPDLYDYDAAPNDSWGAGDFCLMAGGAWGGDYGTRPVHPSAWCKVWQGWLTPTVITAPGTYNIGQVETAGAIYKLQGPFPSTQYFLIENRQGYGFDASLPGTTRGILIWHADENVANNNDQTHYRVDLEEASGTQHLELNTNSGNDADYFRVGTMTQFTNATTPNSNSYTGADLGMRVTNISASGTSMTFDIAVSLPLHHFTWDAIPSPRWLDTPFPVTIRARDVLGNTVTSFTGTVGLTGRTGTGDVTIGTGTSSTNLPIDTYYDDARTQVIYLSSDVAAPCIIESLSLYVSTAPTLPLNRWTIRMKQTPLSSYTTASWEASGWTTCYQNNETIGATGWVKFTFSTPFVYDGSSNLMVDFSHNNTTHATAHPNCRYTATADTRMAYNFTNSEYFDPLTWSGTSSPPVGATARVANVILGRNMVNSFAVSPSTSGNFVGGVWTGNVTVSQQCASMVLFADDGSGHRGMSNAFQATTALDISVSQASDEPGQSNTKDWAVGKVAGGASSVLSFPYRFVVTNNSTVAVDLGLRIGTEDSVAGKNRWSSGASAAYKRYALLGLFDTRTASTPAAGEFEAPDLLELLVKWADEAAGILCVAGATKDGQAVPAAASTNLYLRLDAPTGVDSDDTGAHTITVEVSCKQ